MNVARVKSRLMLEVDGLIDRVLKEEAERESVERGSDSTWMKIGEYARHARATPGTVRRWIAQAAPPNDGHEHPFAMGSGKGTRVDYVKADAWRKAHR